MSRLLASRATGLLREFGEAGLLGVADVQVALRLGALAGEPDERVLLAVALLVRSTRQGSVVLDLTTAAEMTAELDEDESVVAAVVSWPDVEQWAQLCARSPLVDASLEGGSPARMSGTRLWLDRYWRQEAQVADDLLRRHAQPPADLDLERLEADLAALFDDVEQRAAARVAATQRICVVAGGPGTGKTTTIARLLTVLRRQRPGLRIALAAPTGKAANRIEAAVHGAAEPLTTEDRQALARIRASTLHRLLGWKRGTSSRFAHDRDNRLPFDVVVVDECSMVSLTMMARLLEAVGPATRLVLVGDPDQLASVDAGAVLGDVVGPGALSDSVTTLRTVYRFGAGSPIARLAQLIRDGDADAAIAMLRAGEDGVTWLDVPDDEPIAGAALAHLRGCAVRERDVIAAARASDPATALRLLDAHRLLCAHRAGPRGERHWSDQIERWLAAEEPSLAPRGDGRYVGQPLLVTANDYDNELFNGDTGIVVAGAADDLVAVFGRGGSPLRLSLTRLADVRPMHAMTVHRAQGSQFDAVTLVLPPADSPLATRQTIYTGLTRAAREVCLIGSEHAIRTCVTRPAARATGLGDRLAGTLA